MGDFIRQTLLFFSLMEFPVINRLQVPHLVSPHFVTVFGIFSEINRA